MERLTKWNEQTEQAELLSWDEKEWKDFMGSLDVPIATELSIAINKLAEYEDAEEYGISVPVIRCKDCIWWEDEHVLLPDGTRRPYTDEEKKNNPIGVTCDIGINVGSRCMEKQYITTLYRNANDYCSRAVRKEVGYERIQMLCIS